MPRDNRHGGPFAGLVLCTLTMTHPNEQISMRNTMTSHHGARWGTVLPFLLALAGCGGGGGDETPPPVTAERCFPQVSTVTTVGARAAIDIKFSADGADLPLVHLTATVKPPAAFEGQLHSMIEITSTASSLMLTDEAYADIAPDGTITAYGTASRRASGNAEFAYTQVYEPPCVTPAQWRTARVGDTLTQTCTLNTLVDGHAGDTATSTTRQRFEGVESITTGAGRFDACKFTVLPQQATDGTTTNWVIPSVQFTPLTIKSVTTDPSGKVVGTAEVTSLTTSVN